MTGTSRNTKSPKSALTFCNRVTMETWLLLHPRGVGVSRKRVSRRVEEGEGAHNEQCCSKNREGGDEL